MLWLAESSPLTTAPVSNFLLSLIILSHIVQLAQKVNSILTLCGQNNLFW